MQQNKKNNEIHSWVFETINKIDETLDKLTNRKTEKTKLIKLETERGLIQQIVYQWDSDNPKEYFKSLVQPLIWKNLTERNEFLDKMTYQKLNQDEINRSET